MAATTSSQPLRSLYRRFAPAIREDRWLYAGGFFFMLVSSVTTLAYPQIVRIVVDDAVPVGWRAWSWLRAWDCPTRRAARASA